MDPRIIACQVVYTNALFPPFTLANVYALAVYASRVQFFRSLLKVPFFNLSISQAPASLSTLQTPLDSDPTMLHSMFFMGDFNYNSTTYITDTGYSSEPVLNTNTTNTGAAIH